MATRQEIKVRLHFMRWNIDSSGVMAIENESPFPWLEKTFVRSGKLKNCVRMIAKYNGRVVGYMVYALYETTIVVLRFAVAEKYRNNGVAKQMLAEVIKNSTGKRNRICFKVRETDLQAQKLCRAEGFRQVGILQGRNSQGFYSDTHEAAHLMQYDLP